MFAVVWGGRPFDQMAQIVRNNPARRDELAEALQEITGRLRAHADAAGESRGGRLRVLFAGPLTVYFVADAGAMTATVVRVRARFTA
ncbi:hypothetical protein [Gemmata sp.]|uniref:hypothetical protein n=1 Tax=Gemmata sp. TaxID=1914242 RepID=UPI003F70F16C